jgi:hypothetical protein
MDSLTEIKRKEKLLVEDIRFEGYKMIISFLDGNELPVPLAWFPKLYYATPGQLGKWRFIDNGLCIRWPELDESLSLGDLMH